jgi:hypothetical protein
MGTAAFDEAASFALVHAAIAAMREPTEEMLDAWISAPGAIKGGWQAMIFWASLAGCRFRMDPVVLTTEVGASMRV